MLQYYPQFPDEVIDYTLDWSAELGSDTIQTSDWLAPVGITLGQPSCTDTTSTIWAGPGLPGQNFLLVNKITTAGGRTREKSIVICVSEFCQILIDTGMTSATFSGLLGEDGARLQTESGQDIALEE